MKKLTIEYLAAYLPYGLKFQSGHFLVGLYDGSSDVVRPMLMSESKHGCIDWEANFNMDRPILRPLSDLTREITHNGETFVPAERIDPVLRLVHNKYVNDWDAVGWMDVESWPYPLVKQLHSWHFDTFGLGADNLCVYMNPDGTLTK